MTPSSPSDKRAHQRVSKKIVLQVESNGKATEVSPWTLVTTKNFSAGGVLFTYDRALNAGTRIRLKMHFPERAIGCEAIVHRSQPGAHEPLVSVAASLDSLAPSDMRFIEKFIQ